MTGQVNFKKTQRAKRAILIYFFTLKVIENLFKCDKCSKVGLIYITKKMKLRELEKNAEQEQQQQGNTKM